MVGWMKRRKIRKENIKCIVELVGRIGYSWMDGWEERGREGKIKCVVG